MKTAGLYVHVPFCDHKCVYCDFYSIITTDNVLSYPEALFKEIEYYAEQFAESHDFVTIYFGGGTPSLMEPAYLESIINKLHKHFRISADAEVTMETNPGTVSKEKLIAFRKVGINRVSIGIQSFHEDELKFMTRIHSSEQAQKTVREAAEAGFANISADLIFNLPGQTKLKWKENLDTLFTLPVSHLSAYSLILERGTILNKLVLDKKVTLNDDDHDADLYEYTIDYITGKGFNQYEVSNFALPGYECIHNKLYWEYDDYLGLGTSAHSFMNGTRWWNISSLKLYLDAVREQGHPRAGSEVPDRQMQITEYIMLALRAGGLDISAFISRFGGTEYEIRRPELDLMQKEGFTILSGGKIKLTPKGYAMCDELLTKL